MSVNKQNLPYIIVLLVFFVSRAIYDLVGIRFLGNTYEHYWQFINPSLLRTDLWRSVFYLHSQPPLLNALTGIILQIFPLYVQEVFHLLYYVAGMLFAVSIYSMGVSLGFSNRISLIISILFMISPSTIVYEHWLMYGYLIASALAFSGVALHRFATSQKIQWGITFFSLLAFVALSWTLFHILWILLIFIVIFVLFQDRKKVIISALLPLLVVFGWYGKNFVVFGEFTGGSWGGMNLANITTFRLPEEIRRQMIKSGELSKFSTYPPFRNPVVYLKLLPNTPITGIPILDIVEFPNGVLNYHHRVYIDASHYYFQDAIRVIRTQPFGYLRSVIQSLYIFFHSSSDFEITWEIRQPIQGFDTGWNRLFYGQWLNDESPAERLTEISPLHIAWWVVVAFMTGVLGNLRYLLRRDIVINTPNGILLSFMIFNVLFVTIVGNLMDIGENNRFRYVIDSFILLLLIHSIHKKFKTE